MVLPIPVPPGSRDDAVRFVDLSGCPSFLGDVDDLFPSQYAVWGSAHNAHDQVARQWAKVTAQDLARIKDALATELREVFATSGGSWGLAPFHHELPKLHPDAYEAFLPAGLTAIVPPHPDGCLVDFTASNAKIEPQELAVAFAAMPDKATRMAITTAFKAAIDRATL